MNMFSQFSGLVRNLTKNSACWLLLASSLFSSAAIATDPVIKGRTTVRISDVGDSNVSVSLKTPTTYYSALKELGSNFNLLARQIGMDDRNWNKQSPLDGSFIDSNNEIELKFNTPGAARNVKGNQWVLPLGRGETCQLVSAAASHVTLMTAESTEIGLGTMVMDIELPAGATNARFDSEKQEISYDFEPQVTNGTRPELEFEVDHKSTLMSSLAKNYSNPNFTYMWAARSVAKNTGDQILNNYRVRFRVAEMGSWGSWQRAAKVYPGQTVVDPFFPIFDLEKVMSLNGSRPAMIEVEYEYQDANGKKVQESDSFPVQVLSRNEVVFSSLRPEEITGFADQFDFAPALMTSMTTPADPVVQQLAGRINGMAAESYGQSIAASQTDDECVAFMSATFHFLKSNHIAYQSPPGMLTQGNNGQHIKYTRDVLRNRAGTCIDLAVTWASVCEAVGLEPAIVVIPGHAFPAVKLPVSKRWVAIESTMLNSTFKEAVDRGMSTLAEAQKGDHYLINITDTRNAGVLGLDLPDVSEGYLSNLGYSFVAEKFETKTAEPETTTDAVNQTTEHNTNTKNEQTSDNGNADAQEEAVAEDAVNFNPNGQQSMVLSLIGTWVGEGKNEGVETQVGMGLSADSNFNIILRTTNDDGSASDMLITGSWGMRDTKLVLTTADDTYCYEIEFTGDELKLQIFGGPDAVVMKRHN